jgi:small-conductance mechanosensitive channel
MKPSSFLERISRKCRSIPSCPFGPTYPVHYCRFHVLWLVSHKDLSALAVLKFLCILCCILLYRLRVEQEHFAKMIESDTPGAPRKISRINLFATSTLLALIISVPAIVITLIMYYVIKTNLILTVIASSVVLFIAMGFSIKISKRLVRY